MSRQESGRKAPLKVVANINELTISIGLDTLAFAFEQSICNNVFDTKLRTVLKRWKIINPAQFGKDVAYELNNEDGAGDTLVTDLLDAVCERAVENGSLAVEISGKVEDIVENECPDCMGDGKLLRNGYGYDRCKTCKGTGRKGGYTYGESGKNGR